MTFSQAIETIEKYQDNINDQVVRMDDVFAPDEYYLAVSAILPMFKCMNCLANWASRDNIVGDFPFESDISRQFIPAVRTNPISVLMCSTVPKTCPMCRRNMMKSFPSDSHALHPFQIRERKRFG